MPCPSASEGGPVFKFTEAVSLIVNCKNQEEVDEYWAKRPTVDKRGSADG
jgi:predicted 3-demethylubiquinone-9 3-methyltransferase (glyoxalase superfamily)